MAEITKQPAPTPNNSTPICELVISDMHKRMEFGIKQYGVPLQAYNGRDGLVDAYEEALDMCVYLRKEIEERADSGFVADALRTEPEYDYAIDRLMDIRTVRLLHVAMGLCTEAGEFLDALKKWIYYGKPLDTTNLIEELGDGSWYQRIGVAELEITFQDMLQRNVAKLRARYPEKFTEEHANNRDLDAERKTLEGK